MTEIRAFDLFGEVCVDSEDGAKLCDLTHAALNEGESVCLDFSGVTTLASAFLNMAVGCLYSFFDPEDLDRRLHWKGLDATDESIMRFVQRNAIRFYAADQRKREELVASSSRAVEE